jgi:hypothetical protein
MIMVMTERTRGDVDVFSISAIEDISRGHRTLVKVTHKDGEEDEVDLHKYKIDILPNAV